MPSLSQANKATLRRTLLQVRQAMPKGVWQEKSHQLCLHLKASHYFTQARTVLAYFSFRQEPDLSFLLTTDSGQRIWGVPRCQGTSLIWHTWQPGNATHVGSYGICEPHPDLPLLVAEQVDLILIPAIACDVKGYRLGYGGGFYDRLLSLPEWRSKPTVGLVFESARLAALPIDPWDKPLQAVCTEAGFFYDVGPVICSGRTS